MAYDSTMLSITSPLIWSQLQHFNPAENWGDEDRMDVRLLWGLDRVRHDLERRITINCGYEKEGHTPNSFHKLGMAADLVIHPPDPDIVDNVYDLYTTILSMWHGGVGIYPFWNTPGFHLDLGPDRTWVKDKEGKYHYGADKLYNMIMQVDRES